MLLPFLVIGQTELLPLALIFSQNPATPLQCICSSIMSYRNHTIANQKSKARFDYRTRTEMSFRSEDIQENKCTQRPPFLAVDVSNVVRAALLFSCLVGRNFHSRQWSTRLSGYNTIQFSITNSPGTQFHFFPPLLYILSVDHKTISPVLYFT